MDQSESLCVKVTLLPTQPTRSGPCSWPGGADLLPGGGGRDGAGDAVGRHQTHRLPARGRPCDARQQCLGDPQVILRCPAALPK